MITNFSSTSANAYTLEYTLGGKKGYLKYSWDNAGNYTFVSTDVNGNSTTQTYKR